MQIFYCAILRNDCCHCFIKKQIKCGGERLSQNDTNFNLLVIWFNFIYSKLGQGRIPSRLIVFFHSKLLLNLRWLLMCDLGYYKRDDYEIPVGAVPIKKF